MSDSRCAIKVPEWLCDVPTAAARAEQSCASYTSEISGLLEQIDLDLESFLEADGASQGRNAERGSNKGSRI
jgi:hypothetical protein